ncbi:MAG TPA: YihY/virulence factor BrkB family protein [Gemmatimonadaceae bacterium]|nr:YihY/virulence factor BrkB family protein [Gemmatimonadaceae bacterium]
MAERPWYVSLGWAVRDYLKRIWDNSAEDNVLFLAGGIAFNILLAAIPFVLLLITGLTYLVPAVSDVDPSFAVNHFIDQLLPMHSEQSGGFVHTLIGDVLKTRGSVTIYSAVLFAWLSTRLFGSLRTALAEVFDIENERSIIRGKVFDFEITVVGTVLFVLSTLVSTYLTLATTRGLSVLHELGLRQDVMGDVEYWFGRALAFVFITLMFFALYKYLPVRKVRTRTAWLAGLLSGLLFEAAKQVFRLVIASMNPSTLYTGTIAALVIIVVWVYYAALIFLIGGEVGQVYELRRTRKLQREVFT